MFENLSYDELKNLPGDQKVEAWKELHSLYPENKELAQKLGTATIAVVNSIKKYVLNEPVGRVKGSKNNKVKEVKAGTAQEAVEVADQKLQQEQQPELKPKRRYNKKVKSDAIEEVKAPVNTIDSDAFSIAIKKNVSGEDAKVLLNGISNTLINSQQYSIEIKIVE